MSPNAFHRDPFGIEFSHEKQALRIYDKEEGLRGVQGDAPMPIEHLENFYDLTNKVLVLPVVIPNPTRRRT